MVGTRWLLSAAICAIAFADTIIADRVGFKVARADHNSLGLTKRDIWLQKRQDSIDDQNGIAQQSATDPVGAIAAVKQIPNFNQNSPTWATTANGLIEDSSDGDEAQVPWFGDFPFTQTTTVSVGSNGAWNKLPGNFQGFVLKDDVPASNVSIIGMNGTYPAQPYYVSDGINATQVKRVIVTLPGKPRDSWKYANLFYNAMQYVYNQSMYGYQPGEVMIIAPAVLNLDDQWAGGVEPQWLAYNSSMWQMGGRSHYPNLTHSIGFYSALDTLINHAMNKTIFPNVNRLVVAGHSMGGQAVMRYALLKRPKKYDDSMMYWIGNPGSWAWLQNDTQPVTAPSTTCNPETLKNTWPYGLSNMTKIPGYARDSVSQNTAPFVQRFLSKKIHYGLALLDNGAGDTHCQAQYQGASHLERGTNFVSMVSGLSNGGWPANQSLGYVAGVSHQDYPMIAATSSLDFVFGAETNGTRTDDFGIHHSHTHTPNPKEPTRTPLDYHKIHIFQAIAWAVLAAIIITTAAVFFAIDRIFKPNTNDWDRDYWESDFKRRLL
ncbi:hypothetical protein MPSI1_001513 [Malassezia psittaci]|uniref:Uncharacterized protein n=1 Tax=Malassezia psittaci TaxID=1821823 RepID=A0AAF0FDL0_9BASI|nr:hypothetical protein MPSI1_001513 [Malassezia psittaci]